MMPRAMSFSLSLARALAAGWLLVLGSACLEVAEERARIDARVGSAESEGLSVEVARGSAAVRSLDRSELHLWASGPTLVIELAVEAEGPLQLRIENAMPAAALTAPDAPELEIESLPRPSPTDARFSLSLPQGRTTLRLSTPDAEDPSPFRYAVFADVQSAIDRVQDIYRRMNRDPALRFVVMSGDLTDQGTKPQLRRFQSELKRLNVPCFATLGNHELGASEGNYHRYFGRGSHHFEFHGAHFTLLDDASATLAPKVYQWLDGWLTEGRQGFHSVYMHLPPLDSSGVRGGAFASRAEANRLLSKLARASVDLTIYGHVHTYDAYTNAGIPAFITGGGGAIPERFDHTGRHFLAVDVDPVSQSFQTAIVHVD